MARPLIDSFGRVHRDLRISVTDRCNFRCTYCMPAEGMPWLPRVLDGIEAALEAGLRPVKINVVVMRGVNDDELVDFAAFGRDKGVEVRFIEFMPLDAQGDWTNDQVVTRDEILKTIDAVYPLEAVEATGAAPAERFEYRDGLGAIGVIPSVTHAVARVAERVRLTAEGALRSCLFALDEHDLRTPLRAGASDDELAAIVTTAVRAKWAGHQINQQVFIRPGRSMSQIVG